MFLCVYQVYIYIYIVIKQSIDQPGMIAHRRARGQLNRQNICFTVAPVRT